MNLFCIKAIVCGLRHEAGAFCSLSKKRDTRTQQSAAQIESPSEPLLLFFAAHFYDCANYFYERHSPLLLTVSATGSEDGRTDGRMNGRIACYRSLQNIVNPILFRRRVYNKKQKKKKKVLLLFTCLFFKKRGDFLFKRIRKILSAA